jgi:hypothetical protein
MLYMQWNGEKSIMTLYVIVGTVVVFAVLGFMMNRSIKKHDARPKRKAKKGRNRYMPQAKNPGKN